MLSSAKGSGGGVYRSLRTFLSPLWFPLFAVFCSLGLVGLFKAGQTGLLLLEALVAVGLFFLILLLRIDYLSVIIVLALQVYVDWYIGYRITSLALAVFFLLFFFLTRSEKRPWAEPEQMWIWLVFLGVTAIPAMRGATNNHDFLLYYPDIVLGSLIMFWLGTVLARDAARLRLLFQVIAFFGALMALHTIYQELTGKILFSLARVESYNGGQTNNFQLGVDLSVNRAQSFLIDPNWNGTFLVLMLFLPIGLFVESRSVFAKCIYVLEIMLILPAMLFTYSASAWLAVSIGICAFVVFVGSNRYRILIISAIALIGLVMVIGFSTQINLLLLHATDPAEIKLRNGVWQTAYRVIQAYPWTGVGLGHEVYKKTSEHFRVPDQIVSLDHPHNSYLELAAMGGLPVIFTFLALLVLVWLRIIMHWLRVDVPVRALIGAGLASTFALTFNSWANQGWTLPPLAGLAWLILGAISSPLLVKGHATISERQGARAAIKKL